MSSQKSTQDGQSLRSSKSSRSKATVYRRTTRRVRCRPYWLWQRSDQARTQQKMKATTCKEGFRCKLRMLKRWNRNCKGFSCCIKPTNQFRGLPLTEIKAVVSLRVLWTLILLTKVVTAGSTVVPTRMRCPTISLDKRRTPNWLWRNLAHRSPQTESRHSWLREMNNLHSEQVKQLNEAFIMKRQGAISRIHH